MSSAAVTRSGASRPPRVRDQARDAMVLMTFSAVTSIGLATAFFVLTHLGR